MGIISLSVLEPSVFFSVNVRPFGPLLSSLFFIAFSMPITDYLPAYSIA